MPPREDDHASLVGDEDVRGFTTPPSQNEQASNVSNGNTPTRRPNTDQTENSTGTSTTKDFRVGDHVYCWCSYMGIPFAYQHHGLVVQVNRVSVTVGDFFVPGEEPGNDKDEIFLCNWNRCSTVDETKNQAKARQNEPPNDDKKYKLCHTSYSLREAQEKWNIVEYSIPWHQRLLARAGTQLPVKSDAVHIVLARWTFLQKSAQGQALLQELQKADQGITGKIAKNDHDDEAEKKKLNSENSLKQSKNNHPHHDMNDLSECIVVWCKTGNFYSYHGSAKHGDHGADVGSSATLAGGIGMQAAASVVAPWMVPVFAVYDVASVLYHTRNLHQQKKEWAAISEQWNTSWVEWMREMRHKQRQEQSLQPTSMLQEEG